MTADKPADAYEYVTDKQYAVGQIIYESGEPRVVVSQEVTTNLGVPLWYTTVRKVK